MQECASNSIRHVVRTSVQERNYFDSADWALSKQGRKPENMAGAAPGPPPTALPPKLEPSVSDILKPRRSSHLGETEAAGH
jgi:cAMP-regulated phosphoprotein/endosulfine conserved region